MILVRNYVDAGLIFSGQAGVITHAFKEVDNES